MVSAAVLFYDGGVLFQLLRHTLRKNVEEDDVELERVVMASALAWTLWT